MLNQIFIALTCCMSMGATGRCAALSHTSFVENSDSETRLRNGSVSAGPKLTAPACFASPSRAFATAIYTVGEECDSSLFSVVALACASTTHICNM
jgi:hypothetical protein